MGHNSVTQLTRTLGGGGGGGIESVGINRVRFKRVEFRENVRALLLTRWSRQKEWRQVYLIEKFGNLRNDEGGGNNDGQMKSGVNKKSNFACPCNAL